LEFFDDLNAIPSPKLTVTFQPAPIISRQFRGDYSWPSSWARRCTSIR